MTAGPVEVELKYLVTDAATATWLLSAPSFGPFDAGPVVPAATLEDRYLDSADGALRRAGYAGRLRRTAAVTLVTLKSTATATGPLQRREELEAEASSSLDPRDWPTSTPRTVVLDECGGGALVELVTIRQARTRRELIAPGARVELSLDDVQVLAAGRLVDRFLELEAELREGDEAILGELAAALAERPGLAVAAGSKLERAQAAVVRSLAAADGTAAGPGAGSIARDETAIAPDGIGVPT